MIPASTGGGKKVVSCLVTTQQILPNHTKLKYVERDYKNFHSRLSSILNLIQNRVKLLNYNQLSFVHGDLVLDAQFCDTSSIVAKLSENLRLADMNT